VLVLIPLDTSPYPNEPKGSLCSPKKLNVQLSKNCALSAGGFMQYLT